MIVKNKSVAQNPLILRAHRLMEAFAKSDDERDFYLDRNEGFMIYVDLDKSEEDLKELERELTADFHRYCLIPKLTFYETKKIMEGFVNEKVYDIDTKEKLLDIIQSKEARENFLEYIYDHHAELEKWQQYYQERFRVRIIEWLRANQFEFVFEEDLDLPKVTLEKLKVNLFNPKVGKDLVTARKALVAKAKTYYSNEALNPRPKRGRPPKQIAKVEIEPQVAGDIYTTVPKAMMPFLFIPEFSTSVAASFSSKFDSEEAFLAHRKQTLITQSDVEMQTLTQKLASLRTLSSKWISEDDHDRPNGVEYDRHLEDEDLFFDEDMDDHNDLDEWEDDDDEEQLPRSKSLPSPSKVNSRAEAKATPSTNRSSKVIKEKKTPAKAQQTGNKAAPKKEAQRLRPLRRTDAKPVRTKQSKETKAADKAPPKTSTKKLANLRPLRRAKPKKQ